MSLYVDSSALLKRYVDEPDSNLANALLASDPSLLTARHTVIEVRRNLARLLDERDATAARATFTEDVAAFGIVELDKVTCDTAADIAELTGARTLDALHLAAAQRVGGTAIPFVTFDLRQAQAARTLGMTVLPG
jgi:predicted nucleic acid-binding protein